MSTSLVQDEIVYVQLEEIAIDPDFNVRIDYGNVEDLANSIAANGLRRPLDLRKDSQGLILVDGHRRNKALTLLKEQGRPLDKIPVRVFDSNEINDQIIHMIVANDGKPLTPIEEASAFKRLNDAGLSIQNISKRVGKSISHVTDRMSLLSADPELLKLIGRKKMGVTAVVCAIKNSKGDKAQQRKIAETAKTDVGAATKMAYTKNGKPQAAKMWLSKRHKALMLNAFEKAKAAHEAREPEEFNFFTGYLQGIQEMAELSDDDMKALGFDIQQLIVT